MSLSSEENSAQYFKTPEEELLFNQNGELQHQIIMRDIRIEELESAIQTFLTKTQLGKNQSTWTTEDWNHRQAQKLLEVLNK